MENRLKELRQEKNLAQKQVAALLNMSQTGYSKYETGENDIPTKILIKLSEIHEVSVGYLLGVED
ncbi:MAG: helix-turn-helix domain-containing protein [Firmicutes bacterium]|nr:helix-turn-helix domain-containing protein [Bacillota bacterium]